MSVPESRAARSLVRSETETEAETEAGMGSSGKSAKGPALAPKVYPLSC